MTAQLTSKAHTFWQEEVKFHANPMLRNNNDDSKDSPGWPGCSGSSLHSCLVPQSERQGQRKDKEYKTNQHPALVCVRVCLHVCVRV